MQNTFARPITLSFTPLAGQDPVDISSIVACRVYETYPSDDQINDSTNSNADFLVGTTTSSDFELIGDYEWEISLASIDLPQVKTGGWKRYYYAVNFKYSSSEDTVGQWESFTIWYPDAIQSRFDVVPEDIYTEESKIEQLKGDTWTWKKIRRAETRLINYLNSINMDRNRLREADLRDALIYAAVSRACNDISSESGDDWEIKSLKWEEVYASSLKNLKVHYDFEGDNVIDDEIDEIRSVNNIIVR